MIDEPRHGVLHQEEDKLPWPLIVGAMAFTVFLTMLLIVWAWYRLERREAALRPSGVYPERELGPRSPVGEQLQDIYGDTGRGQILFEQQRQELTKFQWVDRRRGVVAIPIEAAMSLILNEAGP